METDFDVSAYLPKPDQSRDTWTLENRYAVGSLLYSKWLQRRGYNEAAVESLVDENIYGLDTMNHIYHHLRFFKTWRFQWVKAASQAGMPWGMLLNLLSYEPSRAEANQQQTNPVVAENLKLRAAQREAFIHECALGNCRGAALHAIVVDWKLENIHLWSAAKRAVAITTRQRKLDNQAQHIREQYALLQHGETVHKKLS